MSFATSGQEMQQALYIQPRANMWPVAYSGESITWISRDYFKAANISNSITSVCKYNMTKSALSSLWTYRFTRINHKALKHHCDIRQSEITTFKVYTSTSNTLTQSWSSNIQEPIHSISTNEKRCLKNTAWWCNRYIINKQYVTVDNAAVMSHTHAEPLYSQIPCLPQSACSHKDLHKKLLHIAGSITTESIPN